MGIRAASSGLAEQNNTGWDSFALASRVSESLGSQH